MQLLLEVLLSLEDGDESHVHSIGIFSLKIMKKKKIDMHLFREVKVLCFSNGILLSCLPWQQWARSSVCLGVLN